MDKGGEKAERGNPAPRGVSTSVSRLPSEVLENFVV